MKPDTTSIIYETVSRICRYYGNQKIPFFISESNGKSDHAVDMAGRILKEVQP